MYLIAGLGNPDAKYDKTRHNVGFHTIDALGEKLNISVTEKKFRAFVGQGMYNGEKLILAKPQTYMNLSGEAIREITEYYKIPPENVIVIMDDVYIAMGNIRIRDNGSAGGHNGLKNIIAQIKSTEFKRIRLGVGPQPEGMPLEVFVLKQMTSSENRILQDVYKDAADACLIMMTEGVPAAMNRYNGKKA